MSRIMGFCLLLLLSAGCGRNDQKNEQDGVYSQITSYSSDPMVKCPDKFRWNTGNFREMVRLSRLEELESNVISVFADNPQNKFTTGFGSSSVGNISLDEIKTCDLVMTHIMTASGPYTEHRIWQTFDINQVQKHISLSGAFQAISEQTASIENLSYDYDEKTSSRIYGPRISLPVTVKCENKWMVKPDPQFTDYVLFKIPEGRCNFALNDFQAELPSGQKVAVNLNGFYEKDSEAPATSTMVNIESLSFRYLN